LIEGFIIRYKELVRILSIQYMLKVSNIVGKYLL
jgi:hypothetical protein